jgi:hypothetical protein
MLQVSTQSGPIAASNKEKKAPTSSSSEALTRRSGGASVSLPTIMQNHLSIYFLKMHQNMELMIFLVCIPF